MRSLARRRPSRSRTVDNPQNQRPDCLLLFSLMDESSKTGLSTVSIPKENVSLPFAWTNLSSSELSFRVSGDFISRELICLPCTIMTGLVELDRPGGVGICVHLLRERAEHCEFFGFDDKGTRGYRR